MKIQQQLEHLIIESVGIGGAAIDMGIDAIRNAFLGTFGDYWYQKAISEHGSYDDPTVKEIIAYYSMPGVFVPGESLEAQLGLALYLYRMN